MKIEVLYSGCCGNLDRARNNLQEALKELNISSNWDEINIELPTAPEEFKRYGSPTILVNGFDVSQAEPTNAGGA